MGILKKKLTHGFTQVPNEAIIDIKGDAFRLYVYLLSRPADWTINNKDLKTKLSVKDNQTIAKYFNKLIDLGWVQRFPRKDRNGRFKGGYDYEIYDRKNPNSESSPIGKEPEFGKFPNHTNTDFNTNNDYNINTESFPDGKLYKEAVDIYFKWFEKRYNVKPSFDGTEGKHLKSLLKKLAGIIETQEHEKICAALKHIFVFWDYLDNFHKKQVQIRQINSNLNNIIAQIRSVQGKNEGDNEQLDEYLEM